MLASLKALLVASFGEEAGGGGGGGGEGGRGSQAEVQAAWQPKEQGGKVSLGVYRTPPGRAGLNYSTRNSDEGWADEAAESLLPLLTQAWEECSPGNVESKASLDCMLVVLAAARIIVRAVKWTPRASAFTRSLTACFPFTPETVGLLLCPSFALSCAEWEALSTTHRVRCPPDPSFCVPPRSRYRSARAPPTSLSCARACATWHAAA